ncbi:MAG: TetR/AcrR family transcriptional regulator [Minwuiales bacterium]|nr:TetR/AcrR family transcriptional regulator [Minwuiales bacterium]
MNLDSPTLRRPRPRAPKAEVRARILDAGRRIVAEGGYAAAQMTAVARRAGIATGTLYLYFPSKADLLAEVFRLAASHEVAVIAEFADGSDPALTRIGEAVRTFVRRAVRGRRLAYALIAEPVDPAVEAERIVFKRAYADIFAAILRDGIAGGELPPQNVDISAACLIGAFTEALVGPLSPETGPGRGETEQLADAIAEFCVRAVMGGQDR